MKRPFYLLFFVLITQSLLSQTSWNLRLNSFIGGAIYPKNEQVTEKMVYLQKQDFLIGINYQNDNGLMLQSEFQNKPTELQQVLVIKKVAAFYQKESLRIGLLKDEIGYGRNSYIFNRHFNNTYYDMFFSESFNFYGIDISKDFDKMTAEIKIGGNTFNKELIDINLKFGDDDYLKLFDMFAFTDNDRNKRMNSIGLEFVKHLDNLTVRGFWDNRFFISFGDNEEDYSNTSISISQIFFTEINYEISQNYGIGYNFLQDSINILKYGKHLAYVSAKKGNFDFDLQYSYYNFENFFDRKISTNIKYKFGLITIDGMIGYAMPSIETNRFEMGFTVGLDYAKD